MPLNRRTERLEQARIGRRQRTRLAVAAMALAAVVIVVLIVWPNAGAPATGLTPDELVRIAPQEAHRLAQAGEAVLLDVRSKEAYDAGRAQGALSLPEAVATQRMGTLPDDGLLVFV
jgi:cytochrome c-type biogenesis protein CcmH/NrfG